jgi:nucleotidyltransferase/DNA polymerase involved in DNA repair
VCVGVGYKMTQRLKEMGVTMVHQLRSFSEQHLVNEFGATNGHILAQLSLYGALAPVDPIPIASPTGYLPHCLYVYCF